MIIRNLFQILFCFAPLLVGAQNFHLQYQNVYGGDNWDAGTCILETQNGNFLIGSLSNSGISGNKTVASYGEVDTWIIKTDPSGNIIWQKSFGGISGEIPVKIISTMDNNFLICGWSESPISGNKTSPWYGWADIWLVKINGNGNILWQKTYGGSRSDIPSDIIELDDGSFLIGATTESGISGNKTLPLKAYADLWVIHVDNQGNEINQFSYGGDSTSIQSRSSLKMLTDQIFILSGLSDSPVSGDKSEPSYGDVDYWILKCNLTDGSIINQKTIGGNSSELSQGHVLNTNNDIICYGTSNSPISGLKTASKWGNYDIWVVKLDSQLNVIWDKSFGGSGKETVQSASAIYSNNLNMIIIASSSFSIDNGNKTSPHYGDFDYWIIGIDDDGIKQMEISLGGTEEEKAYSVIETSTGTLKIIGLSFSDISGVKTESLLGVCDTWYIDLDISLSIIETQPEHYITAYPIPTSSILNFSIPITISEVEVNLVSITGQLLLTQSLINQTNGSFDITSFAPGSYVLKMSGKNFSYSRIVIVE